MKKLILIPLALILLISCQNPNSKMIIGETKLGTKTKIYKKYIHSPVSIYSDKLLTEDSLVSKIESLNSILMVTDRMKNIYEIYDADSLFVGYAGDTLYNKPLTPTYIPVDRFYITGDEFYGNEAIKYMEYMSKIFIELNKSIYNPMGYQPAYIYKSKDSETGYEYRSSNYTAIGPLILWEKNIFDLEFWKRKNGYPRYKNYQYAQNSDFGKVLEDVIDEYVKKDIDTLYIDKEFYLGMRKELEKRRGY